MTASHEPLRDIARFFKVRDNARLLGPGRLFLVVKFRQPSHELVTTSAIRFYMTKIVPLTELTFPVLYSFRRCPYAMRARLAIAVAGIVVELREIGLRNKPEMMLAASPKGTVPVLVLKNGRVIDESLDIMLWAMHQNDPDHWLDLAGLEEAKQLIHWNDGAFKYYLDRYKYADRYPEFSEWHYRQQGELFLSELERRLSHSRYLCGPHFGLADAAILPFIRQFAAVDKSWFEKSGYRAVNQWLNRFLSTEPFAAVMTKYQPWKPGDPPVLFTGEGISGCHAH